MLNDVAPPHRCDDHADTDDAPYCGACMSQQKIHAKWLKARQAEEQLAERDAELERRAAQLELADAAIEDCKLCDSSGYIFGAQVCDHVDRRETARRGSALVRAELARLAEARKANR